MGERRAPSRADTKVSREVLDRLESDVQDQRTLEVVVGYARKRVFLLGLVGLPADEKVVEEVVNDAIEDTALARLTWDPKRVPLSTHLCGAIKSRTSKMLKQAEELIERSAGDDPDGVADRRLFGRSPEAITLDAELMKKVRDALFAMVQRNSDDGALGLLMAYEDGITGRAEIAEATGMSPDDVTNARKRLDRLLEELPTDLVRPVKERLGERR